MAGVLCYNSVEFLAGIERLVRSVPGVVDVHAMRVEYIGPERLHGEMHIVVPRGTAIEEADRIAEAVRAQITHATGCRHFLFHVDPEGPEADSLEELEQQEEM